MHISIETARTKSTRLVYRLVETHSDRRKMMSALKFPYETILLFLFVNILMYNNSNLLKFPYFLQSISF